MESQLKARDFQLLHVTPTFSVDTLHADFLLMMTPNMGDDDSLLSGC